MQDDSDDIDIQINHADIRNTGDLHKAFNASGGTAVHVTLHVSDPLPPLRSVSDEEFAGAPDVDITLLSNNRASAPGAPTTATATTTASAAMVPVDRWDGVKGRWISADGKLIARFLFCTAAALPAPAPNVLIKNPVPMTFEFAGEGDPAARSLRVYVHLRVLADCMQVTSLLRSGEDLKLARCCVVAA